jgi:hypothetical protein
VESAKVWPGVRALVTDSRSTPNPCEPFGASRESAPDLHLEQSEFASVAFGLAPEVLASNRPRKTGAGGRGPGISSGVRRQPQSAKVAGEKSAEPHQALLTFDL